MRDLMRNASVSAIALSFALVLGAPSAFAATAAGTVNKVVPQDSSAVPPDVSSQIQDIESANEIDPEITIPASGGVISGTNVLVKGIATPNAEVDILVQSGSANATPYIGKTVSDKYGVWSYTLAPQLPGGNYTVRASTQIGANAARYSDLVPFTVSGSVSAPGATSGGMLNAIAADASQPFVIIILAIIFSVTVVATMLVWAMVSYLKSTAAVRAQVAGRMEQWEEPQQFVGMNERDWHKFVGNIERVRGQVAHAHVHA